MHDRRKPLRRVRRRACPALRWRVRPRACPRARLLPRRRATRVRCIGMAWRTSHRVARRGRFRRPCHNWSRSVEPWDWSPVYGRKEAAFVLRFGTETVLPAEFAVLLVPGETGTFTQTAPGVYHYKEPQGSHEFIFGTRFVYRAAEVTELSL